MDGGAASVVNSTLRISQIVYEFKAVGEQARDLLASTNHVSKAIETTRTLRRQKSAHLASTEKEWIDSTIADAERTLNNVAALVEPVRVDMQTKFGKIGLVNRGMFVFRDSPKVLTHLNQLSMAHVSLVNALNTLSQRQAQLPPTPSPTLDRRASYATLSRPPTYDESEFLDRRRGKLRSKPSQAMISEEISDASGSIVEDGNSSQHASDVASSGARLSSPAPGPATSVNDEKWLLSEIVGSSPTANNGTPSHSSPVDSSAVELEAALHNGRVRPQTYQAYCPQSSCTANMSESPWSQGPSPSASFYANSRHSMPIVSGSRRNNAPLESRSATGTTSNGREYCSRDPELHLPQTPPTTSILTPPDSGQFTSPHQRGSIASLFPGPNGRPYEMPSRPTSPYPDYAPSTPFPYSPPSQFHQQEPSDATTVGLGVRLSLSSTGIVPPATGYHRAQSYPGPSHAPFTHPHGAEVVSLGGPIDPAAPAAEAQPPIERTISHDIGSLSRRRRYEWLEYHAG